jgi:hypothetical protein
LCMSELRRGATFPSAEHRENDRGLRCGRASRPSLSVNSPGSCLLQLFRGSPTI